MNPDNRLGYRRNLPPYADARYEAYAREKMQQELGQQLIQKLEPEQWYTIRLRHLTEQGYEYGYPVTSLCAEIDLNLAREERVTFFKYEELSFWELSVTATQEIKRRFGWWLNTRWPRMMRGLRACDPTAY